MYCKTMMTKSIMVQLEVEVFERECAEKRPRVGLVFGTKEKFIEKLCE